MAGKQADARKLGEAMKSTSAKGKTPEQWAGQVWGKATGKDGKR